MKDEEITYRYINGILRPLKFKKTNDYMNEKIRQSVIRIKQKEKYKNYDNDEISFIKNNPDVVLLERNNFIDEWTSDSGGYHSNYGLMEYMRYNRRFGEHASWEQGIKDIDNLITGRLNEPIIVFRTIQGTIDDLKVGKSIDENGFIATSLYRESSIKGGSHGYNEIVTIEVQVLNNTRCLYIGENTASPSGNEQELLFPDEYKIEITYLKNNEVKGKMVKK